MHSSCCTQWFAQICPADDSAFLHAGTIGFACSESNSVKLLDIRFETSVPSVQRRELIDRYKQQFTVVDDVFSAIMHLSDDMRAVAACLIAAAPAPAATDGESGSHRTVLLKLDHMRLRAQYSDSIVGWCNGLGLRGALIFQEEHTNSGAGIEAQARGRKAGSKPLILIFLHGPASSIREYLRLHRTSTVDVDSTGRRCKEKMMESIWEHAHTPTSEGGGGSSCCDAVDAGLAVLDPTRCSKPGLFSIAQVPTRPVLLDVLASHLHVPQAEAHLAVPMAKR